MHEVDEADVIGGHRRALRVAGRELVQVDLAGEAEVVPLRDAQPGVEHAVAQAGREHGDRPARSACSRQPELRRNCSPLPDEPWNMSTTGARSPVTGRCRGT